jgi:ABC-type uncharacterized transport system involved in gliding motility auxiliary subunit
MEINKKSRRQLRLQGFTFALLFLVVAGLIAWLSTKYHFEADWTAAGRHTLTEASVGVLKRIKGPVTITAFARDADTQISRRAISEFVERYQRHKPDLTLEFVNPDLHPDKVRENNIQMEGELVLAYEGRRENVQSPTEENLSNALQRLARRGERRLLFLQGHGERKGDGQANHDLGIWGDQLTKKGFTLGDVNLTQNPQIPAETAILIITAPQVDLLPGEIQTVRDYVSKGGNLLWLADPGDLHGLKALADDLGVRFHPGMIVDPSAAMLRIDNPTVTVVGSYAMQGATEGFDKITVFPMASALEGPGQGSWQASPLMRTEPRAWSESSREPRFDAGADAPGPLTIGIALDRQVKGQENAAVRSQRAIVVGDGDFLSNSFVGNGGNLELGIRLVNWLSHEDDFINIPARAAPDVQLEMTRTLSIIIGFGFLLVLPGTLLGYGIYIWMKRRKR